MNYQTGCGYASSSAYSPLTAYGGAIYVPQESREYLASLTFDTPAPLYFSPSSFLDPARPQTEFVSDENKEKIMGHAKETFRSVTGEDFPEDKILATICDRDSMKRWHELAGGIWSEGIMGFALNSNGTGIHRVFARQGPLDEVLLTLGHEIGHVMTPTLPDAQDEEAKAFAFSIAWMQTIVENNIAGLSSFINPQPARNGLHNVAFEFVWKMMQEGKKAMQVFVDIANKALKIKQQPEVVFL